jgi:hypothetical protein
MGSHAQGGSFASLDRTEGRPVLTKRTGILAGGFVLLALLGGAGTVAASGSGSDPVDPTNVGRASGVLQPFCSTAPCDFIATDPPQGLTSGRKLVASATPASDCPEAAKLYEAAGYNLGGFIGPCPTAQQLKEIVPNRPL